MKLISETSQFSKIDEKLFYDNVERQFGLF